METPKCVSADAALFARHWQAPGSLHPRCDEEPEPIPTGTRKENSYAKTDNDEMRETVRKCMESIDQEEGPNLTKEEILEQVVETISCTAICCYEAVHDYWDRSDEGFEFMQEDLERALRLLGQTLPDYAAVDAQWDQ